MCEGFRVKEEFVGHWEDRFPYEAVKEKYEMLEEAGKAGLLPRVHARNYRPQYPSC